MSDDINPSYIRETINHRLDKIESSIRLLKDNDFHHLNMRLTKLEEGQNWMKGLLFSIIGVIIASSVGVILTVIMV